MAPLTFVHEWIGLVKFTGGLIEWESSLELSPYSDKSIPWSFKRGKSILLFDGIPVYNIDQTESMVWSVEAEGMRGFITHIQFKSESKYGAQWSEFLKHWPSYWTNSGLNVHSHECLNAGPHRLMRSVISRGNGEHMLITSNLEFTQLGRFGDLNVTLHLVDSINSNSGIDVNDIAEIWGAPTEYIKRRDWQICNPDAFS